MIAFPATIQLPVPCHFSGEPYFLVRADQVSATPDRLAEIVRIANEPDIYSWLFNERLAGQPYPVEMAAQWLTWAADGWRDNTHFCFAVTDSTGAIAAACDIKSNNPEEAEVGYW